ncbi:hypothetical protein [Actinokineospora globicatena]|uniref:Nuclease-related domain-containing protein n=1 Tax=Actinokineospora globicatena TaxID=103729 RepID=A0A9W6QS10_9PSEU|nr:hypothetical protein [Actinokineospora globicatena]GLW93599.1 hypothetical protein Aglo03_44150 [Actinokineospora globicatena]
MRLVRVGETTSEVGRDVRAALTSWGRGDAVAGGIALLGVRIPGFGSAVEAVVLLPRGVLVVLGVDLPDPALRLEAPLEDRWKVDGWPISRPEGPVNPAANALGATAAVAALVREKQPRPLPVCTVVAVGPYVARVDQPVADKDRGVRILHPEPMTLLAVARELAVHTRPCPIDELRRVLAVLEPGSTLTDEDLSAEGFPDGLSPEAAAERTTILPLTALRRAEEPRKPKRVRWWPVAAAVLVALVLVVGIAVAVSADNSTSGPARGTGPTAPDAVEFAGLGTASSTDCAAHTDGDVRVWLERNGCARLIRGRFEATSTGHRAAVLVGVLRFTGSTSAAELKSVLDRPGGGTVLDQAAEGVAWPGGAAPQFPTALRAAGREGNSVKLVQVVWLDQPSTQDDPVLHEIAGRAMRITLAG